MKIIAAFLTVLILLVSASIANHAFAMLNCSFPFPNQVACFNSGAHGIVGDTQTHTGFDVVMQIPGTQNFVQIFQSDQDTIQIHSIWKITTSNTCFPGWTMVKDAHGAGWGDYFPPGANYCVSTINPTLDMFQDFSNGDSFFNVPDVVKEIKSC